MLQRSSLRSAALRAGRRASTSAASTRGRAATWAAAGVAVATAAAVYSSRRRAVYADSQYAPGPSSKLKKEGSGHLSPDLLNEEDNLECIVWGSNTNAVISPDSRKSIKTPQPSPELIQTALRDAALHERYGVCVDARGDLYQWGLGFSENPCPPQRSLSGKNISKVSLAKSSIFALSEKTGDIYVVASSRLEQSPLTSESSSWASWIWSDSSAPVDFVKLDLETPLMSGEKFTSISAGADHLLALTSRGRTFAMPLSLKANSHGQLGFRKATVLDRGGTPCVMELNPSAVDDPLSTTTPFRRWERTMEVSQENIADPIQERTANDGSIRFCTTLYEVPSLRGIKVLEIATGKRSSYVRSEGKVLAWGGNESGQLGLGANITLPYVTVPSEVNLLHATSSGARTQCTSLSAAGDLAYFVVNRVGLGPRSSINEVLACGQGQWGGLGNGSFSTAQGNPTRIKAVSGLTEYNEANQKIQAVPIHDIVVSPTGHAMLTFETLEQCGPGGINGRDVVVWGSNRQFELGNGKKSSQASPVNVPGFKDMRLMLLEKRATVRDMRGKPWGKARVQQAIIAGSNCSLVYWKICF